MTVKISEPYLSRAREQATQAGYADVEAYLEALIDWADEDETPEESLAAIKEGLAEADAGLGRPLSEVMADIAKKLDLSAVPGPRP